MKTLADQLTDEQKQQYANLMKFRLEQFRMDEFMDKINRPEAYRKGRD